MYWETAISAPEAPTAALQKLLDVLADVECVNDAGVVPTALLQEAEHWGIPLRQTTKGLQLEYPHPPLSPPEIAAVANIPEAQIRILPACASTNSAMLDSDANPGICLAESQWAGRGRRARHWSSPFGRHLAMSYGWTQAARINPALTLVAGLGVFQVLQKSISGLWIKWPNDIWIGGQKLGGLLLEARRLPSGQNRLVLGLGLNVHDDPTLPDSATSLAQQQVNLPRSHLAGQIIRCWQEDFARFDRDGLEPFLPLWNEAAAPMMRQIVQISDVRGHYPAEVLGIGGDGRLQVQEPDKAPVWLSAGDVSLRPLAS